MTRIPFLFASGTLVLSSLTQQWKSVHSFSQTVSVNGVGIRCQEVMKKEEHPPFRNLNTINDMHNIRLSRSLHLFSAVSNNNRSKRGISELTENKVIEERSTPSSFSSSSSSSIKNNNNNVPNNINKLEGKLMKQLRQTSLKYKMIEDGDHIMCAVSGGKDSATMLHLLLNLQQKLKQGGINFDITAVHLNQMQPGYDGQPLFKWLEGLVQNGSLQQYKVITEDTYSIVIDKTPENKTYCSMCSRLRRGILYSIAHDMQANKIALGHHGDDAIETLLLNFIHAGQMKAMPARYYSHERDKHVIRPLIASLEEDIATFAQAMEFPILPCNLCGTQPDAQRAKVKFLVDSTLTMLNPNAKKNMINAMGDVRPSHLLDVGLREACGFDGATGEVLDGERVEKIKGYEDSISSIDGKSSGESSSINNGNHDNEGSNEDDAVQFTSRSRIENLL